MSVADKLQEVINSKQDIKAAIEGKGISVTGGLSSYASAIESMEPLENIVLVDGCALGFSTWTTVPSIFDFSNLTTMEGMFNGCSQMTDVGPLASLNTYKVTNMEGMFSSCASLVTAPSINCINATNTSWMFSNCPNLTTIPDIKLRIAKNMEGMFADCTSLRETPIIDIGYTENIEEIFSGSEKLNKIYFKGRPKSTINITDAFKGISSTGTIYYDSRYTYEYENYILNDSNLSGWSKVSKVYTD